MICLKICSSLISLPKISKWNINNARNINGLFYNCSSLISLPDISNLNTNNVIKLYELFKNCSSLSSLPNIASASHLFSNKNLTNLKIFINLKLKKQISMGDWENPLLLAHYLS